MAASMSSSESDILITADADFATPSEPNLVRRSTKSFDDHPFIWLNKFFMFFPMFTSHTIKCNKMVPRNKYAVKFGYYIITVLNIIFCLWDIFWWVYLPGLSLFTLIAATSVLLTAMSRGICIYYFFYHFQYYGLPHLHKLVKLHQSTSKVTKQGDTHDKTGQTLKVPIEIELPARLQASTSCLTHDQHTRLMNKTNIRFKIILVWVTFASIIVSTVNVIQIKQMLPHDNPAVKYMRIWQAIFNYIYIYFYQIPLFLVQFVLSIYYVRACIFVKEFIESIDSNHDIDFAAAIEEYSTYRTMFKKKIIWVERIMLLQLASKVSWIWVDITAIMEAVPWYNAFSPLLWLSIAVLPFLEMIMSGNAATNKFHTLRKKLYRIGTEKNYFGELTHDEGVDRTRYLFLLEYVRTYPFMIKILAREVSFKNAARVSAAFIIAKTVAYLFKTNVI